MEPGGGGGIPGLAQQGWVGAGEARIRVFHGTAVPGSAFEKPATAQVGADRGGRGGSVGEMEGGGGAGKAPLPGVAGDERLSAGKQQAGRDEGGEVYFCPTGRARKGSDGGKGGRLAGREATIELNNPRQPEAVWKEGGHPGGEADADGAATDGDQTEDGRG